MSAEVSVWVLCNMRSIKMKSIHDLNMSFPFNVVSLCTFWLLLTKLQFSEAGPTVL